MELLISGSHQLIYLLCVVLMHAMKFQAIDCSWADSKKTAKERGGSNGYLGNWHHYRRKNLTVPSMHL